MTVTTFCAYKIIKDCDYSDDEIGEKSIIIPVKIYSGLISLIREFSTEFMLYFYATENGKGNWEVTDIVIPEQNVTTGSCFATEQIVGVQGVFHSHADIPSFMSQTDDDHINLNHNFSIVGNKEGQFSAVTREDLPCGGIILKKAKILVLDPNDNDEYITTAKAKIKAPTYATVKAKDKNNKKAEIPNAKVGKVLTEEETQKEIKEWEDSVKKYNKEFWNQNEGHIKR